MVAGDPATRTGLPGLAFAGPLGQGQGERFKEAGCAAADTSGDVEAVLRAAAELGLPPDALDLAEDAALIRVADTTIVFRHPLVRSALYQGAP